MANLRALPSVKMLVVDDERVNRSILTHYLEKPGQKNGAEPHDDISLIAVSCW
ncbi:MAG: hypothetical protein Q8J61_02670 [Sulfuricella sp.]|nr:hypothetical protein [Sulfuricella sp.]